MKMFQETLYYFDELPYVLVISGAIRSGKTTFLYASSNLLTLRIINLIRSRMYEIERVLKEVNFYKIKELYNTHINLTHEEKIDYVISKLTKKDDLENITFYFDLDNIYHDYLSNKYKLHLLVEYMNLYMHSLRDDYVYSRTKVFNQININYSLPFKPEWMKIKENKDFPLDEYSVFLDDEKSLDSSNIKNSGKSEDDGADVFFRLFGHIFKEHAWYLTTLQNAMRWTKAEREIAQFHIYIKKSYLVGDYPFIKRLLDKLESINQFVYRIILKFKRTNEYKDNINIFKKISFFILQKQKFLTSKGFILFSTNCYKDIDQVGKDINPEKQSTENYIYDFLIPVSYVWNIGDTHAFHPIVDILYSRSKLTRDELGRIELNLDQIDFEDILTPFKDKHNSSVANNSTISDDDIVVKRLVK